MFLTVWLAGLWSLPVEFDGYLATYARWSAAPACVSADPDMFLPDVGVNVGPAKVVCLSCDVRDECLELGLLPENLQKFSGVWGGMSVVERRRLAGERGLL